MNGTKSSPHLPETISFALGQVTREIEFQHTRISAFRTGASIIIGSAGLVAARSVEFLTLIRPVGVSPLLPALLGFTPSPSLTAPWSADVVFLFIVFAASALSLFLAIFHAMRILAPTTGPSHAFAPDLKGDYLARSVDDVQEARLHDLMPVRAFLNRVAIRIADELLFAVRCLLLAIMLLATAYYMRWRLALPPRQEITAAASKWLIQEHYQITPPSQASPTAPSKGDPDSLRAH